MTTKNDKISRWQGAGLLATTLLGTGVFILPQMTIDIAGNDAMIAWLLLIVAIIPITLVFGRLAAKFPHAGGPAHFVEQAYGAVAGRTIGLLFLLVVPLGVPAAILMTFQFVEPLIKLSALGQLIAELGPTDFSSKLSRHPSIGKITICFDTCYCFSCCAVI